jgi:hypothetical protein
VDGESLISDAALDASPAGLAGRRWVVSADLVWGRHRSGLCAVDSALREGFML